VTETLEHTARRIAEHGREALLARMRPAFEEAAAAHSDVLTLDEEQLEQMVQRAADGADGLQWRRALASVATEQLGIGLGEALNHPAVARAQAIVGAPSYEEALNALGTPRTEPAEEQTATPEVEAVSPPEPEPAAEEPEPVVEEELPPAAVAPAAAEPFEVAALRAEQPTGLRLHAVHLGGIANLGRAERDLELHISDSGLDIVRGPDRAPLGRLPWAEITALETPDVGGRLRRRRQADAQLVVRSAQGSASFEIPGITTEELREQLAPLLAER
jgi:hypothetical protein